MSFVKFFKSTHVHCMYKDVVSLSQMMRVGRPSVLITVHGLLINSLSRISSCI